MPAERLSMRNIREILRLKAMGFSGRKIARSLGLSPTTTSDYLRRAKVARLSWPLKPELDDEALEQLLFVAPKEHRSTRPQLDWPQVLTELRRKHVTLALLWEEYRSEQPDGYQYSRFCELYREWAGRLSVWMRQEHRGGEKLFVDYSGDGIRYFDRALAPLDCHPDMMDAMFNAIRAYNSRMVSSEFIAEIRVAPGDGMLIDNHRVMHGRTAFDPSHGRHIRLCHVPRDEFHGRLRELSRTLDPDHHDVNLPQGSQNS